MYVWGIGVRFCSIYLPYPLWEAFSGPTPIEILATSKRRKSGWSVKLFTHHHLASRLAVLLPCDFDLFKIKVKVS
jgi:hypothetical protein